MSKGENIGAEFHFILIRRETFPSIALTQIPLEPVDFEKSIQKQLFSDCEKGHFSAVLNIIGMSFGTRIFNTEPQVSLQ